MNIKGKLLEIFPLQKVSDSFQKKEFVVEYRENPQYPEYIKFELVQDRCALLDNFQPGQDLEVYFNLRGRMWTNPKGEKVYFNSLQAWRIELSQDIDEKSSGEVHPPENNEIDTVSGDDMLPF